MAKQKDATTPLKTKFDLHFSTNWDSKCSIKLKIFVIFLLLQMTIVVKLTFFTKESNVTENRYCWSCISESKSIGTVSGQNVPENKTGIMLTFPFWADILFVISRWGQSYLLTKVWFFSCEAVKIYSLIHTNNSLFMDHK